MYTIWKYRLVIDDVQFVHMPDNAKILTVQTQYDDAVLYALVDNNEPVVTRKFRIYGTGQPIDNDLITNNQLIYIGTVKIFDDTFVGHIFEVK